ncbi:MAG: histidine kinase [Mucinivorans sp.]
MISLKFSDSIWKTRYIPVVAVISAMASVLIHFPELISLFDIYEHEALFPEMRVSDVVDEVLFTFFSLLIMFGLNTVIFGFNNPLQKIGWIKIIISFIFTWFVSSLLAKCFVVLHTHYNIPAIDSMLHHYLHPLRDFIISSVVTSSCYIIHLVLKQQNIMLENQQLRTENIRNQYEALKNQLNPHMLFNSLNTLQSLIRDEPLKAQDYTQELSKVLRYTLQESESGSVALDEEMTFAQAYIYLLKMRYEDNLRFEIKIDPKYEKHLLPPMSVQLLIENAVKHNEISSRLPLTIRIESTDQGSLMVCNAIQAKRTPSTGTGIGLSNLETRYNLLFKQSIRSVVEGDKFCVTLPLISPNDESCNC